MTAPDHLVVTADDFGMARAVNEAVEVAHRDGILTAASLMVGGEAAGEALARARRMPRLRVGLHLVLVDGRSVLPRARIPDLIADDGRLRGDLVRLAFFIATRPAVRRQLTEEIEAQFDAFAATGLPLDHVNTHKHFHLHPSVAAIVLTVGQRYGLRALRVPLEPTAVLQQAEPSRATGRLPSIETLWGQQLRRKALRAGVRTPSAVFGLRWSGAMTPARVAGLLRHRPRGLVEIYTHPAVGDGFEGAATGYRYGEELAALCDPECRDLAIRQVRGGFADARDVIAGAGQVGSLFSSTTGLT